MITYIFFTDTERSVFKQIVKDHYEPKENIAPAGFPIYVGEVRAISLIDSVRRLPMLLDPEKVRTERLQESIEKNYVWPTLNTPSELAQLYAHASRILRSTDLKNSRFSKHEKNLWGIFEYQKRGETVWKTYTERNKIPDFFEFEDEKQGARKWRIHTPTLSRKQQNETKSKL